MKKTAKLLRVYSSWNTLYYGNIIERLETEGEHKEEQ